MGLPTDFAEWATCGSRYAGGSEFRFESVM